MPTADRSEVWLVDLGYAAKTRPCVVLSIPPMDTDRALVTVIPHTTSLRGTRFEVSIPMSFLRYGVFDAQNPTTVPLAKFIRKLGDLTPAQLASVENAVPDLARPLKSSITMSSASGTTAPTTGGFTEDAFHRFLKGRDEPAWLVERRREAFARFQAFPWPSARDEEWRRTDIRALKLDAFAPPTADEPSHRGRSLPSMTCGTPWARTTPPASCTSTARRPASRTRPSSAARCSSTWHGRPRTIPRSSTATC